MSMSMIHHSLIEKACDLFGIPVGGALKINEDGTFNIDAKADDFQQVMGAMMGQIVADHVTATMVLPSNVDKLKGASRDIREVLTYRGMAGEDREWAEEIIEDIDSIVGNLDGCMVPGR